MIGLHNNFVHIRVQILGKKILSSLREAFAIVRGEEGWRGVMLDRNFLNGCILITTQLKNFVIITINPPVSATNLGRNEGRRSIDCQWCTHYQKLRHTWESCWQLHGKPSNVFRRGNGGQGGNQGYKPQNNLANIDEKPTNKNGSWEGSLNTEYIEKLKQFLSQLEKPKGTTCFVQTVKYSLALHVLKEQFSSP